MKEKLNVFHITLLIYITEMNITLFNLPRLVAENIGTNGWIGYLGLAVIATFNIFLYQIVYKMGRGASAFEIMDSMLPKTVTYPVYWALALFWIVTASFIGKNFFLIFQMISFQTTNPMLIFLLFCLMLFYLLIKDIYSISKANTIFFYMSVWVVFLAFYHFREWESVRFTTYLFKDAKQGHSLHSWLEVYTSFVGYEFCLFLFPYVNKQSKLFRGVYLGHWMITSALLLLIVVSFGFFSFDQIQSLLYPVLDLLGFMEFSFINRIENLVFVIFVLGNLIVTLMFCFAALSSLKQTLPRAKGKGIEFAIVLMVFIVGFFPKYLAQSELLLRKVLYIEVILAFSIPAVLICALQYLKLKGKMPNNES
ncbi:GerAB/ArcD/ProY family transporter [Paenibacillus azoreducens]|uniref:Uncharacterized protein n=1 Tax=Paenibacillus azoreducens TaxID=116718 RepID=A0A919YAJ8_9BACL|nr:GerAB/ArcD/ProY family transporter [Paenibacillus azoreducens]GIO45440.1 hypothetical protein J34TS1_02050 [Paenibacillus azoreducens]